MNDLDKRMVETIKSKKYLYGDEFAIEYVCQVLKAAKVIGSDSCWRIPKDGTVKYAILFPLDQQVISVVKTDGQ